jgi:transcriptional regulator with XRE-family HTH domain
MERTISELLRAYRSRHGLTVTEMARKCGVTNQYLYSVEGGGDPSVTRADAMLRAMGVSLEIGEGPAITKALKGRRMNAGGGS